MASAIKIRYKDCGVQPGDMAAFNSYNRPGDFPAMKMPGYEEYIPGDLLDDNIKCITYKEPTGQTTQISEKQFRKKLWDTRGFHNHAKFYDAAPPALENATRSDLLLPARKLDAKEREEFNKKQEYATLNYKHFNPICMEFLEKAPEDFKPSDKGNAPGYKEIHITGMDVSNALKVIGAIDNVETLHRLLNEEVALPAPRKEIINAMEAQEKKLS